MRATVPTIHCDGDHGLCGNWDLDHYETGASSVDGVRITETQRALGWTNGPLEDFCPEHAPHELAMGGR